MSIPGASSPTVGPWEGRQPVRSFARGQSPPWFDNLAAVGEFDGPVLVVHGRDDRLIPPAHGRALAERAQSADLVMLDCGHNDCPRPWTEMRMFLERQGILEDAVEALP